MRVSLSDTLKLVLPVQYLFLLNTQTTVTNAFVTSHGSSSISSIPFASNQRHKTQQLSAEGGPPKYEKRDAILREAEIVADGSVMLHIEPMSGTLDYEPGHVLALEIKDDESIDKTSEKNSADSSANGGWMRGPYTVSRSSASSFDVLIKTVGDKSKRFASAEPDTPLRFGGKYHVPIYEGISKDDTKRVVMISTGTGIGPCIGAIEQMLDDKDFTAKIDLFPSYRNGSEVAYGDYLNSLVAKHPDQLQWNVFITSAMGRISGSDENIQLVAPVDKDVCSLTETHYHLIGNGQLVNEWKAGLTKAGVQESKITVEYYFNFKSESNEEAIDRIASFTSSTAITPATK